MAKRERAMTDLTELRARLAEACGARLIGERLYTGTIRPDKQYDLTTIDGVAQLFADRLPGWEWYRADGFWGAYTQVMAASDDTLDWSPILVPDTGNTPATWLFDLTALVLACVEAQKGSD
jgi:hypothetical protein